MSSYSHVAWNLECAVKPGQLENLKTLMAEMVDATRDNEPGTLNYEWSLSEDGKTCHIYERYVDSSATMIHLASFDKNYAQRFQEVVDMTGCTLYGRPSEEVKQALEGLGTRYMAPLGGFAR